MTSVMISASSWKVEGYGWVSACGEQKNSAVKCEDGYFRYCSFVTKENQLSEERQKYKTYIALGPVTEQMSAHDFRYHHHPWIKFEL